MTTLQATVHRENLQRALAVVERVTSKNASLPILANVLLRSGNGQVHLLATNLEVGVTASIGAKIDGAGQIAVPGRILSDFIRAAKGDVVILTETKGSLKIQAGRYQTTVLGYEAGEYPIIPKLEGGQVFMISATQLYSLCAGVIDSIATTDARPELAGACIKFTKEGIVVAATDSFRLVERRIPGVNGNGLSVIIPRTTVSELVRTLNETEGDIEIRVADNQISFSSDGVEVVSRLVDGRYPEYHKVIPERASSRVLVRRDELEDAVKAVALFSSSISDVKIMCSASAVTVIAKNSSKGEAEAGIEANLKGDPFEISMNHHYLTDGLKAIGTEKVVLEFTGAGSPFVIRPSETDLAVVYLIMPLRS
jgi:DNA polymerase-3 subunit beta